jgi:hypothetical protein
VAEIGRKPRQHGLHVETGAIPAEQGADGEAVAKIVNPRPAVGRARTEANPSSQLVEGPIDVRLEELGSSHGHEEVGGCVGP